MMGSGEKESESVIYGGGEGREGSDRVLPLLLGIYLR